MTTTIRKTVTMEGITFTFDVYSRHFTVKNFSSADILVSFAPGVADANCARIGKMYAQDFSLYEGTATVYVKGNGSGEVEVQEEF